MTQIKLKSDISSVQMNVLLYLFNTWNVEAEVADTEMEQKKMLLNSRRKRIEMNKKYSFSTKNFKFNRDEANIYD